MRREPLHPGAHTTLLPDLDYRYWGHYTDNDTGDPMFLDADMRAHAHVEDHLRRLKASGLERFPSSDLDANKAWMALVCLGADLLRWFQLLALTGSWATAEPKRLRWGLWHTAARIVPRAPRHVVRILEGWPTLPELLDAYRRSATLPSTPRTRRQHSDRPVQRGPTSARSPSHRAERPSTPPHPPSTSRPHHTDGPNRPGRTPQTRQDE